MACTSTCASSGDGPSTRRRAALALARGGAARAGAATSKWWKEERHGALLDDNQNAKDRTVAGATRSGRRGRPRVRAVAGTKSRPAIGRLYAGDDAARFVNLGDRHAGTDVTRAAGGALELSARQDGDGLATCHGHSWKQARSPRVTRSRRRTNDASVVDIGRAGRRPTPGGLPTMEDP